MMYCRVCLHKEMQVFYKLNNNYIALIEKLTEVEMAVNDTVCCFCLTTLRKIQKFTNAVKEVDSLLKMSIKIEEDESEVSKYYRLAVSSTNSINIECSKYVNESYTCNIKEERLEQVNSDPLKMEADEEEDELRQSSGEVNTDNGTDSEYEVPLITVADIKTEEHVMEAIEISGKKGHQNWTKRLKNEQEDKIVIEQTPEKVTEQSVIAKSKGGEVIKCDLNVVLSNRVEARSGNEIREQNNVDTILDASEEMFSCHICECTSKVKGALTSNLKCKHKDEKPFSCNVCSYKCSKRYNLTTHLRIHTGEKPFSCNVCRYKTGKKSDLTVHLRTHTGEKPFSCNVCKYRCRKKSDLTKHVRTHTGEKSYPCNICSHRFSHKGALKSHSRIHTGEKPYSCNICPHKFSHKSALTTHLRTHSGERPYSCDICFHKFIHKSALTTHLRKHSGEKPYSCNICSHKFSQKGTLKIHLTTHLHEKPYSCDVCGYRTNTKCNIKYHLRTVHK